MINKIIFNGFLVQDINDKINSQTIEPYKGTGCCLAWPLGLKTDETAKLLSDEAETSWFNFCEEDKYALAVVPSVEYLSRYLQSCLGYNIRTRVLCIESDRSMPKSDAACDYTTTFLGWDYATSQDFFSALYDDLFGDKIPAELQRFKAMLNAFGLFNNEKDLKEYVDVRDHLLELGYDLEPHGDFCRMKISLVENVG